MDGIVHAAVQLETKNWCNYARILKSEDDVENRETGDSTILKQEVEKAVRMLKDGKSSGVDNIPAEILKQED